MRIYKLAGGAEQTDSIPGNCIFALGCFDGVHIGHRALISAAAEMSRGGTGAAVWCLSGVKQGTLCSEADKLAQFAGMGAGWAVIEDFSAIHDMTAEEFVRSYLRDRLGAAGAVCGFNFRFAAGRAADSGTLARICTDAGMMHRVVDAVEYKGDPVSSSRIRAALEAGNAKSAAEMLGRPYSFESKIIEGKHLGRRIGIPTLNQRVPSGMTVPKKGIYMSFCTVSGRRLRAVTNIGVRPTVETAEDILCESNILDDIGNVYGETVRLELLDFRRDEMKFASVEQLRDTIRKDIEARNKYTVG